MPDHDPHDIVPDGFCESWGAETIPEALRAAELSDGTTPTETKDRCPKCFTTRIYRKDPSDKQTHKKQTAYKCHFRHHFDEPWPPACEVGFDWLEPEDTKTDDPDRGTGRWRELVRRAIVVSKPWTDTEGRTLRETAEFLPYSRAWVNARRQEWRDGQYRDLVAAPLPETADADAEHAEHAQLTN